MEIQVWADKDLRNSRELASFVGYEIVAGLGSCATRVASALVELTDETAERARGTTSLRCLLEVWPLGHAPVVVSRLSATGEGAVRGAVDDMRHVLERMFSRMDAPDGHG